MLCDKTMCECFNIISLVGQELKEVEALLDKQCPRDGVPAPVTCSRNRCKGKTRAVRSKSGMIWRGNVPVQRALMAHKQLYPLLTVSLDWKKGDGNLMQYRWHSSRQSSSRLTEGSFLRPGCVAIAKVMSVSSAPRAHISLSMHWFSSAAGLKPSLAWSPPAQCWEQRC